MSNLGQRGSDDLLSSLWYALDDRIKTILELRLAGFTLDEIGKSYKVTRERIRQLETEGKEMWGTLVSTVHPSLGSWVEEVVITDGTVSIAALEAEASTSNTVGMEVFLQSMGVKKYRAFGNEVVGWWVREPIVMDKRLRLLVDDAPFIGAELAERSLEVGIPFEFPIAKTLALPGSGLVQNTSGHWIKKRNKMADSAYLWLSEHLAPAFVEEIAIGIGQSSTRVLANALHRDSSRFTKVRPEGTWVISEWRNVEGTSYKNASEALLAVLRDEGPLSLQQLSLETQRRYPVTQWRIQQCLYHVDVGQTHDGRYDLIERGGMPIVRLEPAQPSDMAMSGGKLAMKLTVTSETLRGSGIAVNGWLAWQLGLHYYPSELEFTNIECGNPQTVIIRRNGSAASISSLRAFAVDHGLVIGCTVALILDQSAASVKLRHACGAACKQFRPGETADEPH